MDFMEPKDEADTPVVSSFSHSWKQKIQLYGTLNQTAR